MLLDWISGTPLGNETFLEVWEWVHMSYNCFLLFNVFRFTFHVMRGATEEFIERSRLMQFVFRWWRPIFAVHLLCYALGGAYNNWFFIAIFIVGLVLVTINLILQFSLERLERQIAEYDRMAEERKRKKAAEQEDADTDDDDSDGNGDGDRDGNADRNADRDADRNGDADADKKGD